MVRRPTVHRTLPRGAMLLVGASGRRDVSAGKCLNLMPDSSKPGNPSSNARPLREAWTAGFGVSADIAAGRAAVK